MFTSWISIVHTLYFALMLRNPNLSLIFTKQKPSYFKFNQQLTFCIVCHKSVDVVNIPVAPDPNATSIAPK